MHDFIMGKVKEEKPQQEGTIQDLFPDYATEEDNVIKVVDNKLANELLEVLLTS